MLLIVDLCFDEYHLDSPFLIHHFALIFHYSLGRAFTHENDVVLPTGPGRFTSSVQVSRTVLHSLPEDRSHAPRVKMKHHTQPISVCPEGSSATEAPQ